MKKITILYIILLIGISVLGQAPERISYQAVLRDTDNKLVVSQDVTTKISLLQGSENGTEIYAEQQSTMTNPNGLITFYIGEGEVLSGDFSTIDWSDGPFFIKTATDPDGGTNYSIKGTSQIVSVPYSLHAKTAENVLSENQSLADVIQKDNWADGQIKNLKDPTEDQDAVTKSFVTLGLSATGDTLFLGKKQFVIIPGVSAANVSVPVVITDTVSNLSANSATLEASIKSNGWSEITESGFFYSTEENCPDSTALKITGNMTASGFVFSELSDLFADVDYFYKAYAINKTGISYGEVKSFRTSIRVMLMSGGTTHSTNMSYLGRGYDITGGYAVVDNIFSPVLDFARLHDDGKILTDVVEYTNDNTRSGSSSTAYQESLCVNIKADAKYGGFKGEVAARFSTERTGSESYAFATSSSYTTKYGYKVEGRNFPSDLSDYASAAFLADLNSKTPNEIISKYGTDVLLGAKWGARLDYNFSCRKKSGSSGSDIGFYASARYKSLFGNGGGASIDVDKKYEDSFETETVEISTIANGGESKWARDVHDSNDYTKWLTSINDSNLVFMDFYEYGLQPIYHFIADPTKKAAVKEARDNYLYDKRIVVTTTYSDTTVNSVFSSIGLTKCIQGDAEMYLDGQTVYVYCKITITKLNNSQLNANIFLKVEEQRGDFTILQGEKDFVIPVNSDIQSINIDPTDFSFGGYFYNVNQEWLSIDTGTIKWIKNVKVRADGMSGDDTRDVGIKGELAIPLTVKDRID
ncbi:MAG: hypothetical protein JXR22_14255 [Prolixibacteraceae bacterium]|nr:hypothetical protein [Prolixibacteraceae bacterium]